MKFGVCLISNYEEDSQESMLRYADHLEEMLHEKGVSVFRIAPRVVFGGMLKGVVKKFLGYIDKYLFFPITLRLQCRRFESDGIPWMIHVVDHSNALYVRLAGKIPTLVTCHDVGAIKGSRGKLEDCRASIFGKQLQTMILSGLVKASMRVAVSHYTKRDFLELVDQKDQKILDQRTKVILNPIRLENQRVFENRSDDRILNLFNTTGVPRYLFHVGSNLRRKNREVILEVFARWRKEDDLLVFAGEKLSVGLMEKARELGLQKWIVDVGRVDSTLLAQLYQNAFAFLFPSRFEGFGWPIIEAQACGVPVLTADNSAMPEVSGNSALIRNSEDVSGFVEDLLHLEVDSEREKWIEKGRINVQRFNAAHFESEYLKLYEEMIS
jgi:glycosyltransferase involved in cell wall biosynthesis